MADLQKLAKVIDAFADYVDENESKKTAAVETARKARLDKIASAHLAANGEELSDIDRQKLAKADEPTLDYIEGQLAKQAGVVDTLGAGASPETDTQPKTVKEAASAADERFLSWITS